MKKNIFLGSAIGVNTTKLSIFYFPIYAVELDCSVTYGQKRFVIKIVHLNSKI